MELSDLYYEWVVTGDIVSKKKERVSQIRTAFDDTYPWKKYEPRVDCAIELFVRIENRIPKETPKEERVFFLENMVKPTKIMSIGEVVDSVCAAVGKCLCESDKQITRIVVDKAWGMDQKTIIQVREARYF